MCVCVCCMGGVTARWTACSWCPRADEGLGPGGGAGAATAARLALGGAQR